MRCLDLHVAEQGSSADNEQATCPLHQSYEAPVAQVERKVFTASDERGAHQRGVDDKEDDHGDLPAERLGAVHGLSHAIHLFLKVR